MIKKYKYEIGLALLILLFVIALLKLHVIVLPFLAGLLLAFVVNPVVLKIQRRIRNRNLAVTLFLLASIVGLGLFLIFTVKYVNKDFNRLNRAIITLAADNQETLGEMEEKVKQFAGKFIDLEAMGGNIQQQLDTVDIKKALQENIDVSQLDMDAIKASLEGIFSSEKEDVEKKSSGLSLGSWFVMLLTTLMYFVYILYEFKYFDGIREKYLSGKTKENIRLFLKDFKVTFLAYFKLRTRIVLILAGMYLITFLIIGLPGTILLTLLLGILAYVPYLQYLGLIPISLGCLVLSVEHSPGFLVYFGIILAVFILSSILEEVVLNPLIMEKNIGMNPVVMILALSVWGYLFGMLGLLIALPLTSLILIYVKRILLAPLDSTVIGEEIEVGDNPGSV